MTLYARIARQSVPFLIRIACFLALLGISLMVYSVLSPRPLPVILAMSVGHVIGIGAFGFYLLAVLIDVARSKSNRELTENSTTPDAETQSHPK